MNSSAHWYWYILGLFNDMNYSLLIISGMQYKKCNFVLPPGQGTSWKQRSLRTVEMETFPVQRRQQQQQKGTVEMETFPAQKPQPQQQQRNMTVEMETFPVKKAEATAAAAAANKEVLNLDYLIPAYPTESQARAKEKRKTK